MADKEQVLEWLAQTTSESDLSEVIDYAAIRLKGLQYSSKLELSSQVDVGDVILGKLQSEGGRRLMVVTKALRSGAPLFAQDYLTVAVYDEVSNSVVSAMCSVEEVLRVVKIPKAEYSKDPWPVLIGSVYQSLTLSGISRGQASKVIESATPLRETLCSLNTLVPTAALRSDTQVG